MTGHEILAAVVSTWAIGMAVSPVLQIRRMRQTGDSEDVSLGYWFVLIVGFMLWVAYGLSRGDWVLVVPNSVATVFGIATVVVAVRLRRRRRALSESGA